MTLSELTPQINEITRKAGELLIKLSQDPQMRQPQHKEDGSPVTPADLEVSGFLVSELSSLGYLVVSEEALPGSPPQRDQSYFLVDPLDGTKYFSRGEDEFAICVGFLQLGQPVYGGVFSPAENKLYWAQKGEGAFCDQQKIFHSGVTGPLRVYSSGFHKRPEKKQIIDELNIGDILEKGSALKFCDIAKGEVDLYMRFGPTSEWDTAAAQVILEEAGCCLLEVQTRQPMTYGKVNYLNRGVIACHRSLATKVIEFMDRNSLKPRL